MAEKTPCTGKQRQREGQSLNVSVKGMLTETNFYYNPPLKGSTTFQNRATNGGPSAKAHESRVHHTFNVQ